MKVRLIAYGIIREILPVTEWENQQSVTVGAMVGEITKQYPDLAKYKYVLAVNNAITDEKKTLSDGDEVIFIPPFAGG